jgi:hypothetical protein
VLPTVARWFVLDTRETIDNLVQVQAALRCVTPYVLVWIFYVVGYRGSSTRDARELSRWIMSELSSRGCPLGLIYSTVGCYMQI